MTSSPLPPAPPWQKFQDFVKSLPPVKTEESIALRIMVQALVIVGIMATDFASQGAIVWFGLPVSVWAVPLSGVGAIWSWQHRKQRNIGAKFLLAIAMLLMLFLFFSNLVRSLNDTRLVLAELLIQLQILHSFDLPRRKDLGYSMVIGLILLGVAGTVSQTLAFAPWLVLFLTLTIPVLVLDYRSRLGLDSLNQLLWPRPQGPRSTGLSRGQLWAYSPLSPKRFLIFVGAIALLGLGIFAVMPRFPGYQFSNLPVSVPQELTPEEQTFQEGETRISNPGYVRPGNESASGTGEGNGNGEPGEGEENGSPEVGQGLLDERFYYGFNSRINQNLRGEMKKELILRVRSQAPGFWKVMSFDHYTGQGWEVSREEKTLTLKRPRWTYRFSVPTPQRKGGDKRIVQTYTAVRELPNVVPALADPQHVFFPTDELAQDLEGSLRAPIGLLEGLTYTVISDVPYRDRQAIGSAGENYPDPIKNHYLQIPEAIAQTVGDRTQEILALSPKPLENNYEKTLFLAQKLKTLYRLRPDLPYLKDDEDLVTAFLFEQEGGYPDHFSTVLTVMLRSIGIPARLTTGFGPGTYNAFTGYHLVHNTDAFALTEVYFPDYGWFAFDPIPSHDLIPPSFEDPTTFSVLKQFWDWVAGWVPSPVSAFVRTLWQETLGLLIRLLSWFWGLISGSVWGFFLGIMALLVAGLVGWLGFQQLSQWLRQKGFAKLAPMDRLYRQMLWLLEQQGHGKSPSHTPHEYLHQLRSQLLPPGETEPRHQAIVAIVQELTQAYVQWRYGGQRQNTDYLQTQLQQLQRTIKRHPLTMLR